MGLSRKYSAENPAYVARPTLRFAFSHPAHAIALFFGAGLIRPAPGTWGTLAGVLVWIAMVQFFPLPMLLGIIAATFFLGVWASERTDIDLGVHDAGAIVIDEVACVWMVCVMFPQTPIGWLASFVAFRVFDILKLPPTRQVDERVPGGWGVMLDDVFAALWAIVSIIALDALCAGVFNAHFFGVF